jgi:N-acetylneuraminate synthase
MTTVLLGERPVGDDQPCLVIAEIGINHNGDLGTALKLVTMSAAAGADVVKFQKRTVDVVYSAEELARPRENPFGPTNGDLKRGLEFDVSDYEVIDRHCAEGATAWTASCWDEGSVDALERFHPPFWKIASASLTDDALLRRHRATGRPIVMSTGMSTLAEIDHAVDVLGTDDLVLLHCTSTYPCEPNEINLATMAGLGARYGVPVGYSGHERGLAPSLAAVALGACVVERHVTLDPGMWGSDQAASIDMQQLADLTAAIRVIEASVGSPVKQLLSSELPVRDKLRRVG